MLNLPDIGLGVRVFANGPGDLGSIPGRVIPKTQKMVLDASLLSTQHYKVRIKGKVEQSRKGVAPPPTHWCSSYRKGSLRVTLDYGRQLYLLMLKWTVWNRTVYLYKMDLALNNLQRLICHKTQSNKQEFENLIKTIRINCQDTGMRFRLEKCAMLKMK